MSEPVAKDMVGREIKRGDIIAYGLIVGRSANLGIYRVDDVVLVDCHGYYRDEAGQWQSGAHKAPKLKVTKKDQSYGGTSGKQSTIAMLERALVINETVQAWPELAWK